MDAKQYIDTLRRICSTDCFCDNCDFKKNGACPLDKTFLLSTPSEDIISSVGQCILFNTGKHVTMLYLQNSQMSNSTKMALSTHAQIFHYTVLVQNVVNSIRETAMSAAEIIG